MDLFAVFLFLGAVLGHTALTVYSHNWWYGQPINRHVTDVLQVLHGLTTLAGPLLLFFASDGDLRSLFGSDNIAASYVALCWGVGFLVLPVITLRRNLRRCSALVKETSRLVDTTRELGHTPSGAGKYRRLSLLPFNEVFQVEFTEKTLQLPQLPATWDGLSILHLSDLHMCGTPSEAFFEYVVAQCNAWNPDLIALTGDLVDSIPHQRRLIPVLGRLRARIATLAILGNHDFWYEPEKIRRRLRRLGMRVLSNTWEAIEVRGRPMVAIGHEGPWVSPAPDLKACPKDVFRLCLSHTPDNIRWAKEQQIDLMLSGHVHGGQIRLPILGSILVPSRLGRRYDCGTFDESPTLLHVSRGLAGKHPLRFNCRPEVTLLILRK